MADTLPTYLERSARQFGDRLAVADTAGGSLSYRQLDERANQVAHLLAAQGVGIGDRVGLCLPKTVEAVAAIFGILKAGAAYVPVDFTAPAARNRFVFSNCAVRAALVDARAVDVFAGEGEAVSPAAPVLLVYGDGSATEAVRFDGPILPASTLDAQPTTPLGGGEIGPDQLAYILYTSGSTGQPKGVMLTHENATSFIDWCSEVFQPTPDDRFSSHAPFHFDLSVLDLYLSVKHGPRYS